VICTDGIQEILNGGISFRSIGQAMGEMLKSRHRQVNWLWNYELRINSLASTL